MVVVIKAQGRLDIFQIRFSLGIPASLSGRIKIRQDQSGQNPNQGNHDQEFDQGETLASFAYKGKTFANFYSSHSGHVPPETLNPDCGLVPTLPFEQTTQ